MQLKERGWYQRDIAEALSVSEDAVSRWLGRARDGGAKALLARPSPGRPPKLSSAQKRLIPEFLWHGAEAYGFRGEVWTCARVAQVIEEELGVRYHKDHVGRLLRDLHWTPQMPIRRPSSGTRSYPTLARRGLAGLATAGAAGAGFRGRIGLLPAAGVGQDLRPAGRRARHPREADARPPVGHGRHDARGQGLHPGTAGVAQRAALHRVPRAPAARGGGAAVGDLGRLADPPASRSQGVRGATKGKVWVEALPGYAPDLNPWDEGGWHHLKDVEMRNLVCRDLEELHEEFHLAIGLGLAPARGEVMNRSAIEQGDQAARRR